jgi:hypothetical protein
LSEHAVDEVGLLATADPQMLRAGAEKAASVLDGDAAAVSLGVDHGHARRAYGDVVDVAATFGEPSNYGCSSTPGGHRRRLRTA